MAWEGVITNAGNALLQQWVDGKTLHIVSAAAGTGRVSAVSLMAQTALANQKQTASIVSSQKTDAGRKIKLQLTAPDTGYSLSQYGVWARLDDGAQTLLALFQNTADIPIPSKADSPDFVYTFYALLAFSNTGELELHIDPSALVTFGTMGDAINTHNVDSAAHPTILHAMGEQSRAVTQQGQTLAQHTGNGDIHVSAAEKQGWDAKQDALTGQPGQLIGIGDDGAATATVWPSNKNLLINWDFRNPVNRQGKAEYTTSSGYMWSIDKWQSSLTITLGNNGVTLNAGARILQVLDAVDSLDGKELAFGVLLTDQLITGTKVFNKNTG